MFETLFITLTVHVSLQLGVRQLTRHETMRVDEQLSKLIWQKGRIVDLSPLTNANGFVRS